MVQDVEVEVLSNQNCINSTDYGYQPEEIDDTMLCAAVPGGGKDAAQTPWTPQHMNV